ncbi:MAG: DMT family transporter [Rubritepida sp.]|nr:DMT family transporter [Rubritepida sp.]
MSAGAAPRPRWLGAAPYAFVSLWSGGFTAIALCLPHVEPLTLQVLRYAAVVALLLPLWLALRPELPPRATFWHLVRMGLLVQFGFFAAMNLAMQQGISAGAVALIVSMQPVAVAALAPRLVGDPPLGRRGWIGLGLGVLGAGVVIASRSGLGAGGWGGLFFALVALSAMTAGALLERHAGRATHLVTANLVMCAVALLATLPLALLLETMRVEWAPGLFIGLAWMVFVNSLVALSLLFAMLRHGEAARVSSMFFLVPPIAAVMAWAVLGELPSLQALLGTAVAVVGVALVVRR